MIIIEQNGKPIAAVNYLYPRAATPQEAIEDHCREYGFDARELTAKVEGDALSKREARFLSSMTLASEFVGVLGEGYPCSLYRVWVRATPAGKWWRFECGGGVGANQNPLAYQTSMPAEGRACTVFGTVKQLSQFACHPDRPALVAVLARARELAKVKSDASLGVDCTLIVTPRKQLEKWRKAHPLPNYSIN